MATDQQRFIDFVKEMLPPDVIVRLQELTGSEDSDDSFLGDIWSDRFEISDCIEYDDSTSTGAGSVRWIERVCEICDRQTSLTEHHVYPKEMHKTMLKRGILDEKLNETIRICRLCHSTVHRFFSNKELAEKYFTLDLLMQDERMQRFAVWASSQRNQRQFRVK